jgi:hypothetical protein
MSKNIHFNPKDEDIKPFEPEPPDYPQLLNAIYTNIAKIDLDALAEDLDKPPSRLNALFTLGVLKARMDTTTYQDTLQTLRYPCVGPVISKDVPPIMPWAVGPAWDKLDSFPEQARKLLEFMRWRASATKDEVYRAVWGGLSAIGHDERIRQAVCRVNRRLKTSGHGYRLAGGSKSSKVIRWKLVGS